MLLFRSKNSLEDADKTMFCQNEGLGSGHFLSVDADSDYVGIGEWKLPSIPNSCVTYANRKKMQNVE
jgi:hypothetical protein